MVALDSVLHFEPETWELIDASFCRPDALPMEALEGAHSTVSSLEKSRRRLILPRDVDSRGKGHCQPPTQDASIRLTVSSSTDKIVLLYRPCNPKPL